MKSCLSVMLAGCLALVALPATAAAQGTAGVLKSRRVNQRVRLQTVEIVDAGNRKTIVQVALDNDDADFHNLPADSSFLASGPVSVTVRRFNPLTTAVTVTVDNVADPTHATVGKLVEGLLGTAKSLGGTSLTENVAFIMGTPTKGTTPPPAKVCDLSTPNTLVEILALALDDDSWRADKIKGKYLSWSRLIDAKFNSGAMGPAALQTALDDISEWQDDRKGSLDAIDEALGEIDKVIAETPASDCDKEVKAIYTRALQFRPRERRDKLHQIFDAVENSRKSLAGYAKAERWSVADGRDFIAKHSIDPSGEQMRKVAVTFSRISYDAPNPSELVEISKDEAASAAFLVRRYLAWVPEIGVGLTYSNPKRPKYGTAKNAAGETVIGEAESDSSSLDPSILVNFVCGFCRFTSLTPMFQIGASTSKTTPAFFFGGGVRLLSTPKGDFAIGTGLVVPWAKQLKSGVEPGKVIDGTAALESQLEWRRVEGRHVYFSIQYKF